MIRQKIIRTRNAIRGAGALLLIAALSSLIWMSVPAHAAEGNPELLQRSASRASTASSIAANFYLPTSTLRPIFQSHIDQEVPATVNSAINTLVAKLPASNQSWAGQMAKALIQPDASLTNFTVRQDGLATTLSISLYPGDPKPMNASILVTFSVKGGSTIQVSAQALNNDPSPITGPLTTFNLPVGQLTSVQTTPDCGAAALALGSQFPISLNMQQGTATAQPTSNLVTQQTLLTQQTADNASTAYVEIPASSLADLGPNIGTIPLNSNMSARNIQVAVQDRHLVVTSDIYLGPLKIGQAMTLITPQASNGNLAVNVTQTKLSVLILSFEYDSYNQRIEQLLNDKLSGALRGTFTVQSANIGANSQIPCAADDSLIIGGTTGLIS